MYSGLPVPRLFGARRTQQIASPTPDIQSAASFFRLFFNFSLIRGPVLIEGTSLHLTPAYQPLACPFNFLKAHTALQRHWNWKIPGTLQLRCNAVRNEQIQQEICLSRCSPQLVCHFVVALSRTNYGTTFGSTLSSCSAAAPQLCPALGFSSCLVKQGLHEKPRHWSTC